MKDMMPWVIGAVVAYMAWKFWQTTQGQGALLGAGAGTGAEQAKYPEGGTGYTQYSYPANVVV